MKRYSEGVRRMEGAARSGGSRRAGVGIGRLPCAVLGTRGARQFFKINLTAFPDLHLDIQQMLAAGDSQVVVRWRSRGTHLGPLGDIPATGRKASNHGCTVMKGKNSKGGHAWVYFDKAHLLRQIGVLPGS